MSHRQPDLSLSKFALGTVQFGLPYGIANIHGQMSREEAIKVLTFAKSKNINTLDTAIAYGNSEDILGSIGVSDWQIITKLPCAPKEKTAVNEWMKACVQTSLQKLRASVLYGLLLHRPLQLLEENGVMIYHALVAQKESGLVKKIGISVYEPEELNILPDWMRFDIVQVPMSIIDHRFEVSGWIERLNTAGVEVHARSVFLQGLLLLPENKRPKEFHRWYRLWHQWENWLTIHRLSPLQACARYAHQSAATKIVIGVDNVKQLEAILTASTGEIPDLPTEFFVNDPELLNPVHWQKT